MISNEGCNIKKDCGAYDYVFQMWTEWILTILKYEKGQLKNLTVTTLGKALNLKDFSMENILQDNQGKV